MGATLTLDHGGLFDERYYHNDTKGTYAVV
jgi:hypothetical protein